MERLVRQFLERHLEDLLACLHEPVIACHIGPVEPRDLGPHALAVGAIAEHHAVIEPDLVERIAGLEHHIVRQPPAAGFPQVLEHIGRGDDGRPGIEGKAILPVGVGAATWTIQLVEHGHAVSLCGQARARCKPAYPAANHHGVWAIVPVLSVCAHQHATFSAMCRLSSV
jgi:hypothetical protein